MVDTLIIVMSFIICGFTFSHNIKEAIVDYKKGEYFLVGMDIFIGILTMGVALLIMTSLVPIE